MEENLILEAQNGSAEAVNSLLQGYKSLVNKIARSYFLIGGDMEDIVQEGMIGLYKAIINFSPNKHASFKTFASLCITRQIISAIRMAGRDKHKALNTYVSLSDPLKDDNGEMTVEDTLRTNMAENPETLLVMKDIAGYILHNGDSILSELEMEVLNEVLKGRTHEEIAERLNKNSKSIDNAMQRIKKKIVSYLWR